MNTEVGQWLSSVVFRDPRPPAPSLSLPVLTSFLALAVHGAELDPAALERLTGLKGTMSSNEGLFKVTAARTDLKIAVDGWTMPPFMGLNTWAAFAGTDDNALVDGDFAMTEDELQPVLKSLRHDGIHTVANALRTCLDSTDPLATARSASTRRRNSPAKASQGPWPLLIKLDEAVKAKVRKLLNPKPPRQTSSDILRAENQSHP